MIELTFPDKSTKKYKEGITGQEIAEQVGQRLAKDALAIKLNDTILDTNSPLKQSGVFSVLTWDDLEGKKALWHTAAHVLAEAVLALFPHALPTIGPTIENGFYYDFAVDKPFTPRDLERIEQKMLEIISKNKKMQRKEISKSAAEKMFSKNKYKIEVLQELEGTTVSIYSQGAFSDLCKGPHIPNTGRIKAVRLLKVSAAYWRGDQTRDSLQRIYGTAFPDKKMLAKFVRQQEEAEKRNHIKLGKQLELFAVREESPGSAFWLHKGTIIYNQLIQFMRNKMAQRGYKEIITPLILKKELWRRSGHWEHYKDLMYMTEEDNEEYAVKPMNCPGCILVYKLKKHSYKELPLKIGEFGVVHRKELSGVLNGLFRVRKFTQDDAHIFCMPEQLKSQIGELIELTDEVYHAFGFMQYSVEVSTKPEKAMGSQEDWDRAEAALKEALEEKKVPYTINEGDGAFYGPKIDFHITDSLGRKWQLTTIQVDFQMPQKFEVKYTGSDDKEHVPVMIHRAIFGSLERFIGILIEHYAGKFPLWLSPEQACIIPIADRHTAYAQKVEQRLQEAGIRARVDSRNETVSYKVREAEQQHIPLILAVGDRDQKNNHVSVREKDGKAKAVTIKSLIEQAHEQIAAFK